VHSISGQLEYEAVLWSPSGKATVLHDAGGRGYSEAFAINDAGQSVGISLGATSLDAVLWAPSGKATVLQDVAGWAVDQPTAINDAGQSVGWSHTASGQDAVLWSPSGKATDLGAVLGSAWSSTVASGINDRGDIIGYGDYQGGLVYGFLLTPVPEPSTWIMMLVGFAGLGFLGYRGRLDGKGEGCRGLKGRAPLGALLRSNAAVGSGPLVRPAKARQNTCVFRRATAGRLVPQGKKEDSAYSNSFKSTASPMAR
jgi:probable HAF family extracellular repeat protein